MSELSVMNKNYRYLFSWKSWFTFLLSFVFLWLAFRSVDVKHVLSILINTSYPEILASIAVYFLGVLVRAFRWGLLLSPYKRCSIRHLFSSLTVGYMGNDVLPARAGEFVRVYLLSKFEGVSKSLSLGTIIIERFMDAIVMLAIAFGASFLVSISRDAGHVMLIVALLLLVAMLFLISLAYMPYSTIIFISRLFPIRGFDRIGEICTRFISGVKILRSPRIVVGGLILSSLSWMIEGITYWLVAKSIDFDISFSYVLLTLAVANLFTLIPAAPGYIGTFEAGVLLALSSVSFLSKEAILGYAFLLHVVLVVPVILVGTLLWFLLGVRLSVISSLATRKDAAVDLSGGK